MRKAKTTILNVLTASSGKPRMIIRTHDYYLYLLTFCPLFTVPIPLHLLSTSSRFSYVLLYPYNSTLPLRILVAYLFVCQRASVIAKRNGACIYAKPGNLIGCNPCDLISRSRTKRT